MTRMGRWTMSVLLGIDQLGGVLLSPLMFYRVHNPDETISSRLGKLKRDNGMRIPWKYPIAKVIDAGLELLDPGHSIGAIEEDEA